MKPEQSYTVTQLNHYICTLLEFEVGEVLVSGEISNLSKPSSGHFYFTLKDTNAQVRCVFFRNYHNFDSQNFQNGQQVLAKGGLSLYEPKGEYQLVIRVLNKAGWGELYLQFQELKMKLQKQGLFDEANKKTLPSFPKNIGIITSATGAALQDIVITLARRYPLAEVKIYATEVQGKQASIQLIHAIHEANAAAMVDVLILARGGGSIEDLWAFNDEQLAQAIYASKIPIVSGVGHETDFTIADFVADLRAATPTAAAEAVTPNRIDLLAVVQNLMKRLLGAVRRQTDYIQSVDYLEQRLHRCIEVLLQRYKNIIQLRLSHLQTKCPLTSLSQDKTKLHNLKQRMIQNTISRHATLKHYFTTNLATLHAVSPLATLKRGYAIVTANEQILYQSGQVKPGTVVKVKLAQGNLVCNVIKTENKHPANQVKSPLTAKEIP